jgi:phospholipid/cholesterol/gamma-HCH transport system substrate-binding protein
VRRIISIALVLIAVPLVLVFAVGANDGGGGGYEVRAVFDYVRAVPGEDVKVAGARVGAIKSLDVTKDEKAAVVLSIDKSGFTPFHKDAHCTVRPQSLIGETFVECSTGTTSAPDLDRIPAGQPGAGQHLLPVTNTSSPVDIDLLNNTLRGPYGQRLAIIIDEFGAGLAGRGSDLNEVIHRANPALRETDKVLATLAKQNRLLARLAVDSDRSLAPLARQRTRFANFIVEANRTAQASAERSADISASFQKLPQFLREFQPTLKDLGDFAGQASPVVSDLRQAAPGLNRFFEALGPFSTAALPAFQTLGDASDAGRVGLKAAQPTITKLADFASDTEPVAKNLSALAKSLDQTEAIDNLMKFVFFGTTSINGFDEISHFLRAGLIVNTCATYAATAPVTGCSATFTPNKVQAAGGGSPDPILARTRTALRDALLGKNRGKDVQAAGTGGASGQSPMDIVRGLLGIAAPKTTPGADQQRKKVVSGIQNGAKAAPKSLDTGDPAQPVLDYLLGNDG